MFGPFSAENIVFCSVIISNVLYMMKMTTWSNSSGHPTSLSLLKSIMYEVNSILIQNGSKYITEVYI